MFGHIAAMSAAIAITEIRLAEQENRMFEASIADLPIEEKKAAREKRRLEKREDRMHREMCQAIRDSKPVVNNGISMAGMIFASCLTSSMINSD